MATLTVTFAANTNAGAQLRRLASRLQAAASVVPDNASTGASTVLTIDNAPSTGTVSVQLTSGPYTNAAALIV